jgi:hypothetical protein
MLLYWWGSVVQTAVPVGSRPGPCRWWCFLQLISQSCTSDLERSGIGVRGAVGGGWTVLVFDDLIVLVLSCKDLAACNVPVALVRLVLGGGGQNCQYKPKMD